MTISEPKHEHRPAQPYVAIKVESPISSMGRMAKKAMQKIEKWLVKNNVTPSGPPFWRYTIINMEGVMHLEVGYPVDQVILNDQDVVSGFLPAGDYVTMLYTGPWAGKGLYFATRDLLEWGARNNIEWDRGDVPEGDAWASRIEWYFTDPDQNPDPKTYETELAFKVK